MKTMKNKLGIAVMLAAFVGSFASTNAVADGPEGLENRHYGQSVEDLVSFPKWLDDNTIPISKIGGAANKLAADNIFTKSWQMKPFSWVKAVPSVTLEDYANQTPAAIGNVIKAALNYNPGWTNYANQFGRDYGSVTDPVNRFAYRKGKELMDLYNGKWGQEDGKNPEDVFSTLHLLALGDPSKFEKRIQGGASVNLKKATDEVLAQLAKNGPAAVKAALNREVPDVFKYTAPQPDGACYEIQNATPIEVAILANNQPMVETLGKLMPELKKDGKDAKGNPLRHQVKFAKCGEPLKAMDAYDMMRAVKAAYLAKYNANKTPLQADEDYKNKLAKTADTANLVFGGKPIDEAKATRRQIHAVQAPVTPATQKERNDYTRETAKSFLVPDNQRDQTPNDVVPNATHGKKTQ
jgi:hypothetical protein